MSSSPPSTKRQKTSEEESDVVARGLQAEQNVGITEFIGSQRPFVGVLKHRFEDFVVHEISPSGQKVKITCSDEPEELPVEAEPVETIVEAADLKLDTAILEAIEAFSLNPTSTAEPPVLVPTNELDKEGRTKVHAFIRQKYPKLDSKTESIDGKGFIRVIPFNPANLRRGGFDRRRDNNNSNNNRQRGPAPARWPKTTPNYVHFALYKENLETVQAVNELCRRLNCTTKHVSFAGNKDKRAITTQMFAIWRTSPRAIWRAVADYNRQNRFRAGGGTQMAVGHFSFAPEPLNLGDLSGNHFEVLLRDVRLFGADADEDHNTESFETLKATVEQSLETVRKVGFINYFGMQRFGSHRVDSHKLGILLLRKEWKAVVNEILLEKEVISGGGGGGSRFHGRNDANFNEAIRLWRETGDAGAAYRKLVNKYSTEGSLLRALSRLGPNDYHGALCVGLPRNSRLLYLHAYQSYLWNRVASYRYRQYGLEVVEGDLVFIGKEDLGAVDLDEGDGGDDNENGGGEEAKETEESTKPPPPSSFIKSNIAPEQIVLVTAANRHQFTIYDVVLPIIGGLSRLPTNSTASHISALFAEDGITGVADFAALSKQWCVNGSYRRLVVRPKDYSWSWRRYTDASRPLILTDRDRLSGKTVLEEEEEEEEALLDESAQTKHGLLVSFTLPSSSYATVFLREVTKLGSLVLEKKPWMMQTAATSAAKAKTAESANDGQEASAAATSE